jgi:hypothetical protein
MPSFGGSKSAQGTRMRNEKQVQMVSVFSTTLTSLHFLELSGPLAQKYDGSDSQSKVTGEPFHEEEFRLFREHLTKSLGRRGSHQVTQRKSRRGKWRSGRTRYL